MERKLPEMLRRLPKTLRKLPDGYWLILTAA